MSKLVGTQSTGYLEKRSVRNGAVDHTKCVHYWLLENPQDELALLKYYHDRILPITNFEPREGMSRGYCKKCGETKYFQNSIELTDSEVTTKRRKGRPSLDMMKDAYVPILEELDK